MLKKFWVKWLEFGRWLGDMVARVVLVAFYFTIALPFGLLVRFAQDPLDLRGPVKWTPRETRDRQISDAKRSF